ncbi:MAG: tyrosine-type recombinase/integrase [Labedaea sp.]
MTKRRSRGDGGLYWSEARQRWIAEATIGYTPAGKRITRKASGKTKTAAMNQLKEILRDIDDGSTAKGARGYTVADAVNDWLTYGLPGRDKATIAKLRTLADTHVIPFIGARKLAKLTAEEGDAWLADRAKHVSTRTMRDILSIAVRAIKRAQAREKVKRNVLLLCECPAGQRGRPSKSLTFAQADALLLAAERDDSTMGAYIVTSLLSGLRTEEVRPLTWPHVHLPTEGAADHDGSADGEPKAHVDVWRSVRAGGDTKTPKSRRSLAIPQRCVDALRAQQVRQDTMCQAAGNKWRENGLVFTSKVGTDLDAANVRRGFRRIATAAGLVAKDWTPRELRHSFVSLLSDHKVPIEVISRLVGHKNTKTTELIYRHQIRPVVEEGADEMDRIFPKPAA